MTLRYPPRSFLISQVGSSFVTSINMLSSGRQDSSRDADMEMGIEEELGCRERSFEEEELGLDHFCKSEHCLAIGAE